MKRIHIKKAYQSLVPADQETLDYVNKLKYNEVYAVNISKARNYPLLQKYMVMIRKGYENTDIKDEKGNSPSLREYRIIMQRRAKLFNEYGGEKIDYSVAFDKMSEDEFEEVYSKVKQQVAYDIGSKEEDLELELLSDF